MNEAQTSTEIATARLRESILRGELVPGEKLHQDRLAESFGLSRTPLRTALTALTQSGLVVYESNRGFRVREFSVSEMRDAFRIRAELEALACRLAAPIIPEAQVAHLKALVALGDQLLSSGRLEAEVLPAYRQMNVDFHTTVLRASGNSWIETFIERLHSVPLASDRIIMWDDFGIIHRSHDDHRRIAHALGERDGHRAAGIMFEHISFAAQHLIDHLHRRPEDFLRLPVEDPEPRRKPARPRQPSGKTP